MAIEFVGGNTSGKAGATSGNTTIALNGSLTGGIASAVAAGDLVIAAFATGSAADRTLAITDGTSNYTLINSELAASDTEITNLRVAYKFMGGTPDASTTFGPTGNNADAGAMAVYVFRGVDSSTPLDVAAVPATGTNTSRPNPAGITPTTAGAFIVCVGAGAHDGGVDTFSSSDLTDFLTVGGTDDTNDITLGIGHIDNWSSGEFNAAAWTHTQADSANYSWAAMSIALRPFTDTVDDLLANDVSSASSVTSPAIGQAHALLANDVSSSSSVSVPGLGQVHVLLANDVSSASSVTAPALTQVVALLADDVSAASSVTEPAIGQIHVLGAEDVVSSSSVTAPTIGQLHVLLADDVLSSSSVGVPSVGQVHALLADDVSSASSVSTPAIGQVHALLANDVMSASSVTEPALAEGGDTVDDLLAEDVSSASSVGTPTLGQIHALLADDASSNSLVSVPAFGQAHALLADDVSSASSVSLPVLSQIHALLANSLASMSLVSVPSLQSGEDIYVPVPSPEAISAQATGRIARGFLGREPSVDRSPSVAQRGQLGSSGFLGGGRLNRRPRTSRTAQRGQFRTGFLQRRGED
jgi:hypothetical protein